MRKYLYKNIRVKRQFGRWIAEYKDANRVFTLHVGGYATRFMAYNEAKKEVDFLNASANN